jgi:shikimate kinase
MRIAYDRNLVGIGSPLIRPYTMRIFLAGVSCVGKTTIGAKLADRLGCRFFDLDAEIEGFFGTPIDRLMKRHLTMNTFRNTAAQALKHTLSLDDSANCVIALPPSGLLSGYWKVVKNVPDATIVVLWDKPENILKRITFYDDESRLMERILTDREKTYYLRKIKEDISYFKVSFRRAHMSIDITGCNPDAAACKVRDALIQSPLAPGKLLTRGVQDGRGGTAAL